MNWKKILATATFIATLPTAAFAHGELWYDASSRFGQLSGQKDANKAKVVVYPLEYSNKFLIEDELKPDGTKSEVYQANDYFNKRFVRKLKVKTIALGVLLDENKKIRQDDEKYKPFFENFGSPVEKKAEIFTTITGGRGGFIIPTIDIMGTEPHKSPATPVTVQMYTYMKEVDGPNGTREYNRKTWTERHIVPEKDLMLYHFGLKYNMYDREGKKMMTYRNAEHTYGEQYGGVIGLLNGLFGGKQTKELRPDRYRVELFKSIVDEFKDDFEDSQKNFKKKDDREKGKEKNIINKTIGFRGINLPRDVGGDEYALKSIYFSMKDLAYQYTKLKVDYSGKGNADYYVQGTITHYTLDRKWIPPTAEPYDSEVSSEDFEWTDREGNKHTGKRKKYESKIRDIFGHYDYVAIVSGTFQLVDSSGRVIVEHSEPETDDKTADAYRHFLKKFYDKVNVQFGGKR